MDVIIGVIISIVLCGLVILICACQKKEEKTSAEEKTPTEEKTSTTAQQMRNLAIKAQKAKAEREHQEDVDNGQKFLGKLSDYIYHEAIKGFDQCVLKINEISGEIYFDLFDLDEEDDWEEYSLEEEMVISKFNDIDDYFITIIQKYCEENGFEAVVFTQSTSIQIYCGRKGFKSVFDTQLEPFETKIVISW